MTRTTGYKFVLLIIALIISTTSCSNSTSRENNGVQSQKLSVSVTFDALSELAAAVGGDRVSITKIIPDGAEMHSFEPKAKDLTALSSADVFILCGLGLEPWADNALAAAANSRVIIADVSKGITPIAVSDSGSHAYHSGEHEHNEDDKPGKDLDEELHEKHSGYDPHIWLSLKCAAVMAGNIRDVFCEADPESAEVYKSNYNDFTARLDALYELYTPLFAKLKNKTIVTGHAVFAYLCRDFGITQSSVEGVFADGEPNARRLAELADYCREKNIKTILAEHTASPLISETLAREAGASVALIYTLESAENGLSYIERMTKNLDVIYQSIA